VRFGNAFTVTWPAVAGDVDLGDFIAIEALRLFQPALHKAIRENQSLLCGSAQMGYRPQVTGDELDAILLSSVSDKAHYRQALMRLFPKLQSIWANTYHSGSDALKRRRACSSEHFCNLFPLRAYRRHRVESGGHGVAWCGYRSGCFQVTAAQRTGETPPQWRHQSRAALDALSIYGNTVPIERADPAHLTV
jgi:hypothetical protein